MRERRGRRRLLQVPQPHPRDRPRAPARAGRARHRPRPPARGGPGPLRADLRPRPVHAQPLHARRDDRQQLLRRALGDVAVLRARPAHFGQRRRTGGAHLPRRAPAGRAPRATACRPSSAERLHGLGRPLRRPGARALPEDPAARLGLQPRRPAAGERLPRRPRPRRHRGHLRHASLGHRPPDREPALPHARRRRLRGRRYRSRPRPGRARAQADRPRGRRRAADRGHDDARHAPARPLAAPGRTRVARDRGRRRDEGGGRREGAGDHRCAGEGGRRPQGHEAVRRPRFRRAHLEGARGGAGSDRVPARQARHARGLGGLGGPARAPRRLPAQAEGADRALRLRERALRPLRPGLRARPLQLRPRERRGDRHLAAVHGRGGRPRALVRRLAVGRARRRAVARRAAPEDVRRRARRGVRRVQGDLGPGRQDEPGQGRRSVSRSRRISGSGASYRPKPVETHFAYPDDGGSFAHATVRCVGIGNCRRTRAA